MLDPLFLQPFFLTSSLFQETNKFILTITYQIISLIPFSKILVTISLHFKTFLIMYYR